uniref:Uncharacterized protein n=1 Tax=Ananas comosus var. bracteatus TaxID=296719 RepID=A0A6V7QN59_ANACO|nr:unnamed protein product [Ananas comosus var. bracteatus]
MGQSGRLNELDKFHSVFRHFWKSKNEFQRCWNGFSVVRCEKKPKQLKKHHSVSAVPVQAGGCTGHISRHCPGRTSPVPSIASDPAIPGHYGGAPPIAASAGRALAPRQSEVARSAPSGWVFAAQVEESATVEDAMAGMV